MTQVEIGKVMGMKKGLMSLYVKLLDSVSTDVLLLAKKHQGGRVDPKFTNVDDFTEGWFGADSFGNRFFNHFSDGTPYGSTKYFCLVSHCY